MNERTYDDLTYTYRSGDENPDDIRTERDALRNRVAELEEAIDEEARYYHESLTLRARIVELEKVIKDHAENCYGGHPE